MWGLGIGIAVTSILFGSQIASLTVETEVGFFESYLKINTNLHHLIVTLDWSS